MSISKFFKGECVELIYKNGHISFPLFFLETQCWRSTCREYNAMQLVNKWTSGGMSNAHNGNKRCQGYDGWRYVSHVLQHAKNTTMHRLVAYKVAIVMYVMSTIVAINNNISFRLIIMMVETNC